ncbi:type II toxin-antitoxin system VapB family antitoxin [Amycolatopsis sp. GM8]|uniref:type II toxin-antitoxin system VapB family antitoxin n=1 Tax=Amycolatopsis sp. GM8 TaxID=2896530 RepID=UPI001F3152B7|nr:type II toxin-antitoxin system VapB family antitoxin [Amycolatopsis sp. GM8]
MKRLIDVDDESLEAARSKLGTSTIKDTVNAALRLAANSPTHAEFEAAIDTLAAVQFDDRQQAWR